MIMFSSMQLNDTKIQEFGRNEGIESVLHCQDTFLSNLNFNQTTSSDDFEPSVTGFRMHTKQYRVDISERTQLKHLCFLNQECDGFTFSTGLKCILHKTATAFHYTERRMSQVGIRKRSSTFPKYCEEEQRQKRCKNEPQCKNILNCFRKSYHEYEISLRPKVVQPILYRVYCIIAMTVMDITQDISKMILDASKDHVNAPVLRSKIKLL